MIKSALYLLFLLALCHSATSNPKEIVASFGGTLPPWVIEDGSKGILIDLLKDCLEPSNYKVTATLTPYARRFIGYQLGRSDVVSDVNDKIIKDQNLEGFYTGDIYAYENFLYSLSEKKITINKIEDLASYSLLSWQGAIAHIGGKYAEMAKQNKQYSETHNQKTQLRMLFNKRVDFIQMDGSIYQYYHDEMQNNNEVDGNVSVKKLPLFGKSPNGFLFKTESARDSCLKNLTTVKNTSSYYDILYIKH
ncbi:MAG: polar amino acid transport system substrate-binding protein [Oceanicoccus sp.]|jgi:polar amino acid transport system substrate-binding protein